MSKLGIRTIHSVVKLFGKLPLGFHYWLANVVSWMAKNVVKYRTDVVYTNIARSFPGLKYWDIKHIADVFYAHFGEIFAEAVWFSACDYNRIRKSNICTVKNPELVSRYFQETPSVTVLFSHCGNWELLGGLLAYQSEDGTSIEVDEADIKVVYKKLHSDFFNEFFKLNRVAPLRKNGDECEVESEEVLRYSLKRKDVKTLYIYIADQYPYQTRYDIGEFMHQPTTAMLGSVKVAHKLGHSVLYMRMKHLARGKYEISFEPICDDASKVDPESMIRKYFDLLEEDLNEHPHNWLWTHKRWK